MASLEFNAGPMKGQHYEIDRFSLLLGRDPACDIAIRSMMVSRRHARIVSNGRFFFLEDLNSSNGTILNGKVLHGCCQLQNGDSFQIDENVLIFHGQQPASAIDSEQEQIPERHGDTAIEPGSTFQDDSTMIKSVCKVETQQNDADDSGSAEFRLQALLEVMQQIGNALTPEKLSTKLLDSLFRIFSLADRGFILMMSQQGEFKPLQSRARDGSAVPVKLSRSIIEQVMRSKEAILSEDAGCDQRFDSSRSILAYKIHSVICAPLIDQNGRACGIMQLDSFDRSRRFQDQDLQILSGITVQASIAFNNAYLHEKLLARKMLERDLELAHQVQQSFLPAQRPVMENFRFFHEYRSAEKVGGDFFDYIMMSDGRIAVIVADVAGHGVAAALLMVRLSAQVRFCLAGENDPVTAVNAINDSFCRKSLDDRFITFVMLVIDPARDSVTIVNAGHMPPLFRDKDGSVVLLGKDGSGVPLGIVPGFEYEQVVVRISPGVMIVLYTDGINEARNEHNEFFGEQRIKETLALCKPDAETFGKHLINAWEEFGKGRPPQDDITLVAVSRNQQG